MKKIKETKMIYESIKIPENLEYKVNNALRTNKNKSRFYSNRVVTACSSVCLLFILLLNVNPSFANAVNDIPVIGKITSIFTIREYFKEDDSEIINVKEPAISTTNKNVEDKINNIIANKIKELEKESEMSVDEIKKEIDYKDRKGSIYPKVNVRIDYEIKYNKNNILSFVLIKEEGINTTSKDLYTYNFNLETGNEITLEELLGNNYEEIINKEIRNQIAEREAKDKNQLFFNKNDNIDNYFKGIMKNQNFYINENKNPVVVFNKYEIAPGYMGIQEFEIKDEE